MTESTRSSGGRFLERDTRMRNVWELIFGNDWASPVLREKDRKENLERLQGDIWKVNDDR